MVNVSQDLRRISILMTPVIKEYAHPHFESGDLFICKGIRLGNYRDQIDLGMEATHHLNVQWLQGMTSRLDEVDARVNPIIDDVHTVDLVLSVEIGIKTLLDVLYDWLPRIVVVDKITKAGSVNDCESKTYTIFFDIRADRLNGNGLGDDVETWALALFWRIQRSVEECVDKG